MQVSFSTVQGLRARNLLDRLKPGPSKTPAVRCGVLTSVQDAVVATGDWPVDRSARDVFADLLKRCGLAE